MADEEFYRVLLDREWGLDDLYEFPRAYSQNYAFVYCLDSNLSPRDRARITRALEQYPWQGGYSYVNIYTVLQNQIPQRDRPRIKSISKASPGWLDLFLNVDVAIQVAKSVSILAGSMVTAAYAYKQIQKVYSDIKLNQKRHGRDLMRITQSEAKIVTEMCKDLAKFLGFKNLDELHKQTGDPEVTLKLLLAHYRRIEKLVEYVHDGKAVLPHDGSSIQ